MSSIRTLKWLNSLRKIFWEVSAVGPCQSCHIEQFSFSITRRAIVSATSNKSFPAINTKLLSAMGKCWSCVHSIKIFSIISKTNYDRTSNTTGKHIIFEHFWFFQIDNLKTLNILEKIEKHANSSHDGSFEDISPANYWLFSLSNCNLSKIETLFIEVKNLNLIHSRL